MGNINFTANLINYVQILKRDDNKDYKPADASIVELDKEDCRDVEALRNTSYKWTADGARFASEIYNEAIKGYEYDNIDKEHYFALTSQKSGFENLDSGEILGLMLYSRTNCLRDEINWLQVRPDTNYVNSHDREYKGVGRAFIDLVKEYHGDNPVYVNSSNVAVDFYKKLGFTTYPNDMETSLHLDI